MRRLLLIPLCVALLAGSASAATVLRVGVDDLTDQATVIVRGKVLSVTSKWTDDKATIHTQSVLAVSKVLKGKAGKEITITCPGGRVGNEEVRASGLPKFTKGEEAVIFLWKNARGEFIPLGYNQGRFRIRKDEKTGEEKAENSLEGLAFAAYPDPKGGRRKIKRTPDSYRPADLEKKITDRVEVVRKAEEARKAAEAAEAAKKAEEARKAEEAQKAAAAAKKEAGEKKAPIVEPETPGKPIVEPEKKPDPKEGESEKAGSR